VLMDQYYHNQDIQTLQRQHLKRCCRTLHSKHCRDSSGLPYKLSSLNRRDFLGEGYSGAMMNYG
jgi:hypothetical protein